MDSFSHCDSWNGMNKCPWTLHSRTQNTWYTWHWRWHSWMALPYTTVLLQPSREKLSSARDPSLTKQLWVLMVTTQYQYFLHLLIVIELKFLNSEAGTDINAISSVNGCNIMSFWKQEATILQCCWGCQCVGSGRAYQFPSTQADNQMKLIILISFGKQ